MPDLMRLIPASIFPQLDIRMAFQSQTYANSNSAYYLQGGAPNPNFPTDGIIQGPIEIAPALAPGAPRATYYNRFVQSDLEGLVISEYSTPTQLMSRIVQFPPSNAVSLQSLSPGQEAVLNTWKSDGVGNVSVFANDGLRIQNYANAGTGLQLFHDGPTNENVIKNFNATGTKMVFNNNTNDITFETGLTPYFMRINSTADNFSIIQGTNSVSVTPGGMYILQGLQGAVGTFGGSGMTLDSQGPATIRTNTAAGQTPLTNMTANTNGTVTFLSTISAPRATITTGSFNTVNTTNMNTLNGSISTLNAGGITTSSLTSGLFTVSSATISSIVSPVNIANINGPTTISNLLTTSSLTVATGQASVPSMISVSSINALPIASYVGPPPGSILPYAGVSGTIPTGYLLCDGTYYSQVTYSGLFAIIGIRFDAAAPVGQFAVPDLRTKTIFGASNPAAGGTYTFQVVGATFSQLPATSIPPIDPTTGGPYPLRQAISITNVPNGYQFNKGQFFQVGTDTIVIIGIINSDSSPGGGKNIVLILQAPLSMDYAAGSVFTIRDDIFGANFARTSYGNLREQAGNEVGLHNHGTVATGSNANAGAANQRSEPTFGVPGNSPNGTFTINSANQPHAYSMNVQPSCVFMNWIIKF